MANNYKHSGKHVPVLTASAAITSGNLVYQEGFVGVALTDIPSGGSGQIARVGVWRLTVPSGVARGDLLYADLFAGESVNVTLTETATANSFIGVALTDRDSAGTADVLLNGPGVIGVGDTS